MHLGRKSSIHRSLLSLGSASFSGAIECMSGNRGVSEPPTRPTRTLPAFYSQEKRLGSDCKVPIKMRLRNETERRVWMCKPRRLWDGVVCVDSEETVKWYPVRERDALQDIRCPLWLVVQDDRVCVPW